MAKIDSIDRPTDAAFLLFYIAGEVEGITKVQKLLFLIENETKFGDKHGKNITFNFKAYKMGPFSAQVYDEITMLLNMDAIETENLDVSGNDSWEFQKYNEGQKSTEELTGKRFIITEKGKKIGKELADYLEGDVLNDLRKTVEKYNDMSLNTLLEYVYKNYEHMTVESEIKDQVLY